eukprot:756372-Hanusia_phi.AAC.4
MLIGVPTLKVSDQRAGEAVGTSGPEEQPVFRLRLGVSDGVSHLDEEVTRGQASSRRSPRRNLLAALRSRTV